MKAIIDRTLRRVIRHGRLEVTWADGSHSRYGNDEGVSASILFRTAAAERKLAIQPELALGECYMDGEIEFPGDKLVELISLMNHNWDEFRGVPWVAGFARMRFLARRITQNNDFLRARRNVAHHYDLDERLYRLFLDRDMQYSCA